MRKSIDGIRRKTKKGITKTKAGKTLSFFTIAAVVIGLTAATVPSSTSAGHLASGLAGYWNLEEGIGNLAADSAHGNDGTLSGDTTWSTDVPVLPSNDYSLDFDGIDDVVTVPDASELDITDEISVAGWIKLDSFSTQGTVLSKWRDISGANERGYLLTTALNGTPRFYISTDGANFPSAVGAALSTNTWYHLVGTYDGTDIKLYVNGALAATTNFPGSINLNDEPVLIGANDGYGGSNRKFTNGKLDEVRIYNRALSEAEVNDLMEDADGILGEEDLCPDTASDEETWDESLGTNRWELNDDLIWQQAKPKGGLSVGPLTVAETYGCSGQQILDLVSDLTGEDMDGHYKFGLSTSVLNEFIEDGQDGVIDGFNTNSPTETVVVPADDADGVLSAGILTAGKSYKLKAYGTADACETGCGYSIIFDAEYSTSDGATWVDGVAAPYDGLGPDLLDLKVDGNFVDWDDDAIYNLDHTYWYELAGTDAQLHLQVYDVFYPNNTGSLSVDIYVSLY